jgi:hypothetical protein
MRQGRHLIVSPVFVKPSGLLLQAYLQAVRSSPWPFPVGEGGGIYDLTDGTQVVASFFSESADGDEYNFRIRWRLRRCSRWVATALTALADAALLLGKRADNAAADHGHAEREEEQDDRMLEDHDLGSDQANTRSAI